ncbi:hypothetical protein Scep_018790 [Stephania cephalantha]|uniref:Uncharacterized protein n=1 Tax=Stephania cephalantha TaxID=152367 RepID=A0AAP0IAM2_9MAGN
MLAGCEGTMLILALTEGRLVNCECHLTMPNVDALEMLLGAYFAQIEGTLNKLSTRFIHSYNDLKGQLLVCGKSYTSSLPFTGTKKDKEEEAAREAVAARAMMARTNGAVDSGAGNSGQWLKRQQKQQRRGHARRADGACEGGADDGSSEERKQRRATASSARAASAAAAPTRPTQRSAHRRE